MSANAQKFDRRRLVATQVAEDGYDYQSYAGRNGLIARSVSEAKQCNRKWAVGMKFIPAFTYCPNGLMDLSDKGIKIFEEAHPGILPWNLYKAGPAGRQGYYSYNLECTKEVRDEFVSTHARFGGWMKAATKLPLLVRAISMSVSPRGTGSRRTYVDLWALAQKYPSPHRLQRLIAAVQYRAIKILRGYDGRGCTLRSVLMALTVTGSVGKAAVVAVHRSLTGSMVEKYSDARNALVVLHRCKVTDGTDGVAVHRTAEPVFEKMGVRVYPYAQKGEAGWKRGLLVLSGTRTFHIAPDQGYWGRTWVGQKYFDHSTPEGAMRAALEAWGKQKKLERENKQFFSRLQPVGFCPIVYYQDSRAAGNCHEGTVAFMNRIGIRSDRQFVPVSKLLPYMDEGRVMNVLKLVAREVTALGF